MRLDPIALAAARGLLASGVPVRVVQARTGLSASVLARLGIGSMPGKAPAWTEAEDNYLRRHLGYQSDEDMAAVLGRTTAAVHLRWKRDLRLPAPSKAPGQITASEAGRRLHVDTKAVMRWVDMGLLPGRRLPLGRAVRSVSIQAFEQWVLNPLNWIYFQPERVTDPHLRRMLDLKAARWDDAWLTPGQVARLHGVTHAAVNNAIHAGRLRGVKWGNWRILRSEATRPDLHFFAGKGGRHGSKGNWSEAADAFIVVATALGFPAADIARMMGGKTSRLHWTPQRVAYRLTRLKEGRQIQRLIRRHRLKVHYRRGQLTAEWRHYRRRFKRRPDGRREAHRTIETTG